MLAYCQWHTQLYVGDRSVCREILFTHNNYLRRPTDGTYAENTLCIRYANVPRVRGAVYVRWGYYHSRLTLVDTSCVNYRTNPLSACLQRVLNMERHDCLKDDVIDSCCAWYILCRWVVRLCCLHIMMSCACSILCRWVVRLCCLYIMMSCAFSISCRWVVVLCCQNNIIILCCHHIMTSCASFILCCWVTMLYWMFGTDLTFGTNELPVDKVLFPSQAISLFCYIGLL